jgi:hypothetical protein
LLAQPTDVPWLRLRDAAPVRDLRFFSMIRSFVSFQRSCWFFFFWKHFLIRFKSMSELPPILISCFMMCMLRNVVCVTRLWPQHQVQTLNIIRAMSFFFLDFRPIEEEYNFSVFP